MRTELYKILNKEHKDDFIKGCLYMNDLNYFRGENKNAAQGDRFEGVCGSIRKDQLRQFGGDFDEDMVNAIQGSVSLISDYYGLNNLFCMYQMLIDDERKLVEAPSGELCQFNDEDAAGKVVVRIKDTQRFLSQLEAAVNKGIRENELEYGIYGGVIYSSAWINADGPGTRSAFHKDPQYAYQKEWRLCLLRNALESKPYRFFIGDLSDITEEIPLEEFIAHPEAAYPGYSPTEEKLEPPREPFRIFGNIDTVNHLMFSYMAPSGERPTRSDRAQADWHYTQYLQLCGRRGEIDDYLNGRMRTCRDLEHLELLVEYRLSVGEWVKATDAFMFFSREAPEAINEDPGRFFFSLHTILMQNRQPEAAGKVYMFAAEKYKLPEDLKRVMLSDVLFAQKHYEQAIPLFQKMKETSKDPILDYYLAVSWYFAGDVEKADRHLAEYERYFSHSTESAGNVARLRGMIKEEREKKREQGAEK